MPLIYSREELKKIGFRHMGKNINISKNSIFINPQFISIDDDCRIDSFCILSAGENGIFLNKKVHISAGVYIYGGGGEVRLGKLSNLSARVILYTSTDDFSKDGILNALSNKKFRNINSGNIILEDHACVGAGSIVLPNCTLGRGSAVGAMSLINCDLNSFGLYYGIPAKFKKMRK